MELGFGASHVPAVQSVATGSGIPVTSLKAVDATTFLPATLVTTSHVALALLSPIHQERIARFFVAPRAAFRPVPSEREKNKFPKTLVKTVVTNKTEQANNHLGRGGR